MFYGIDLASDTATRPTREMKEAMIEAPLGDEQRGEDPTTKALEERVADLLGFDAAFFFPSAAMCNQVALKLHLRPGEELIAVDNCHLFFAEAGGPAINAQAMMKPVFTKHGIFSGDDVRKSYRWNQGPHYPITRLVSVENTTNMGGGSAWTLAEINHVLTAAKDLNLKTHLDGARLFNAAVKIQQSPKALASGFDSVTVCLSKGLGCPVGAVLAFRKEHLATVRRLKQLMGGALRQSGMLAAAGLYALDHNIERLQEDHDNAAYLAAELANFADLEVESHPNPTNMVFFSYHGAGSAAEFNQQCVEKGLRFSQIDENRLRAVTHLDIDRKAIDKALTILRS